MQRADGNAAGDGMADQIGHRTLASTCLIHELVAYWKTPCMHRFRRKSIAIALL